MGQITISGSVKTVYGKSEAEWIPKTQNFV